MPALVTLTTDFGLQDAYVGAMKGAMLSVEPTLRFADISHLIEPQEVLEAAFVLSQAMPFFPPETVHLAVVDPGVGTTRRPIAARLGRHTFVGPDNGILSLLLDGREPDALVVLDKPTYWRTPTPSPTFHGRDLFGPVAAHLAAGRHLNEVGTPTETFQHLHWALPIADEQGIQGWVLHIDRYGNCVTNIPHALLEQDPRSRRLKCYVGSVILEGLATTYADVPTGEPLALIGSSGYLEIGVNGGRAATLLTIRKGSPITLVFGDD